MKRSFAARRVPRKIGGDEADDAPSANTPATSSGDSSSSEPTLVKRPSSKPRKSSALRTSFGLSALSAEEDKTSPSVITPKRNPLSRLAIQRNAEQRTGNGLPFRAGREEDDERPSYSKDYLQELKQSTPSTPKDLTSRSVTPSEQDAAVSQTLDLASKFGSDLSRYKPPSAIPTDAEIQEKKARRARLAKENDFLSLDDGSGSDEEDDENVTRDERGKLILKPKEKYPETRLVRDDEDLLEDFDDFTTDGKIGLGRKAEKEAAARRKAEMAALIADAEGVSADEDGDEEEEDESEVERNAAFETAQTRHGTYASRQQEEQEVARPRTPPRIAPLPGMDAVVARLRKRLVDMQAARMGRMGEMQGLVEEKRMLGEEEVRVQAALKETAEKYTKLRADMGLAADGNQQVATTNGDAADEVGPRLGLGAAGLGSMNVRGLDSLDGTPVRVGSDSSG